MPGQYVRCAADEVRRFGLAQLDSSVRVESFASLTGAVRLGLREDKCHGISSLNSIRRGAVSSVPLLPRRVLTPRSCSIRCTTLIVSFVSPFCKPRPNRTPVSGKGCSRGSDHRDSAGLGTAQPAAPNLPFRTHTWPPGEPSVLRPIFACSLAPAHPPGLMYVCLSSH